jgi:hypothetical protein
MRFGLITLAFIAFAVCFEHLVMRSKRAYGIDGQFLTHDRVIF